jgi:hypothetical protein
VPAVVARGQGGLLDVALGSRLRHRPVGVPDLRRVRRGRRGGARRHRRRAGAGWSARRCATSRSSIDSCRRRRGTSTSARASRSAPTRRCS